MVAQVALDVLRGDVLACGGDDFRSFLRPRMRREPSASKAPVSPLCIHPSASMSAAVALGSLTYPRHTLPPLTRISLSSAIFRLMPGRAVPTVPMRTWSTGLAAVGPQHSVWP